MPIEALPESTTRVIGSTLVISDARSVVKELVDNALDARATAIHVEISQNTLDVIQVKDNGTGIGVQDRQLLCKRGCTSKIRSLDDLNKLGGAFLGFRGEALASLAELSHAITITTKVEGEVVGTALTFDASGMLSSSSASHPVGTTFRVQQFLQKIPVRKQTALKSAAKILQATKALLYTFAFARPEVRFSLKVLKAKSDKANWTYAPSPKDGLLDVASKIVGKDVALACEYHQASSADIDVELETGWEVHALLASSDADTARMRSAIQYVSIDGRPVASDRATIKEIAKLYKRYLQAAQSHADLPHFSRPFLCLQIKCPPESYDVNIEPAKDQVLFFRPEGLVSLMEALFTRMYGVHDPEANLHDEASRLSQACSYILDPKTAVHEPENDDTADDENQERSGIARETCASEDFMSRIPPSNPFTIAATSAKVLPKKMETISTSTTHDYRSERAQAQGPGVGHPILHEVSTHSHGVPLEKSTQLLSPDASSEHSTLYQNPGPPMRRRTQPPTKECSELNDAPPFSSESHQGGQSTVTLLQEWLTPRSSDRQSLQQSLQTSRRSSSSPTDNVSPDTPPLRLDLQSSALARGARSSYSLKLGPGQKSFRPPFKRSLNGPESTESVSTLLAPNISDPAEDPPRLRNRDFMSDIIGSRALGGSSDKRDLIFLPTHRQAVLAPTVESSLPSNTELEDIMDFEHRKKAIIAHQRRGAAKFMSRPVNDKQKTNRSGSVTSLPLDSGPLETSTNTMPTSAAELEDFEARFRETPSPHNKSDPHHNRYLAAVRHLSHSHPGSEMGSRSGGLYLEDADTTSNTVLARAMIPSALSSDDPRAYLIKQQHRGPSHRIYRTKSSRLPLESIPPDAMTVHLTHKIDCVVDQMVMSALLERLKVHDRYFIDGNITHQNLTDITVAPACQETVRELIKAKYRSEDGEDMRMRIDDIEILHLRGSG